MNLHPFAETHDVTNQPPSLDGTNLYRIDLPLQEWSRRFGAGWAQARLDAYGALAGGPLMAAGFLANQNKPVFNSHDRYGHRIDQVDYHPAYHELMAHAIEHGHCSLPWTTDRRPRGARRTGLPAHACRSRYRLPADDDLRQRARYFGATGCRRPVVAQNFCNAYDGSNALV